MIKICPSSGLRSKNCGGFLAKKDGKNSSQNQRFKCKDCLKRFVLKNKDKNQSLLLSYIAQKKTLKSLAKDATKSISTIQRTLKSIEIAAP